MSFFYRKAGIIMNKVITITRQFGSGGREIGKKLAKMKRVMDENEPITDGAPPIYTPKESGVVDAYNIRADRWQIAMNAMDRVNSYKASEYLKNSENKPTEEETKPTTKPTVNEETHQE